MREPTEAERDRAKRLANDCICCETSAAVAEILARELTAAADEALVASKQFYLGFGSYVNS